MTSHIVYEGVQQHGEVADIENTLFGGQKLWFAHTVPQRKYILENARNNGAIIVDFDKDADVKLVDHARKNNAPGTHSYKYVEVSIRNGRRENLADHAVGIATRVSRPVGSTTTTPRQGRIPFTSEEDQQLWDWVKPYQESGGTWKGNEIYKQLEAVNPRHTYQSWRDRWIKKVQFQRRTTTPRTEEVEDEDEAQSPSEASEPQPSRSVQQRKRTRSDVDEIGQHETRVYCNTTEPGTRDRQYVRDSAQRPNDPATRQQPTHSKVKAIPRTEHSRSLVGKNPSVEASEFERDEDPQITTEGGMDHNSDVLHIRQALSIEKREQLYDLVPALSDMTAELFQEAWADLVIHQDWNELSPKQWQIYFEKIIVPDYCRRNKLSIAQIAPYLSQQPALADSTIPRKAAGSNARKITCGFCHEGTSATWHVHKQYELVCTECAIFLRVEGVPGPPIASAKVDHDLGSRIDSRISTDNRTPQPSMKSLLTPTKGSKLGNFVDPPDSPSQARNPEPNEARKRSSARVSQSQSTSQESQHGAREPSSMLEIVDNFLEEQELPQVTRNDNLAANLSPPSSSLESINHIIASKNRGPRSHLELEQFDTAPETIDDFDSALEEIPVDRGARSMKGKGRRLSTQALFEHLEDPLDVSYLDLPDPEGGWEEALGYMPDGASNHELDTEGNGDEAGSRTKGKGKARMNDNSRHDSVSEGLPLPSHSKQRAPNPVPKTTSTTSGPATSSWVTAQTAIHKDIHPTTLRPVLFKVLEATSFDVDAATRLLSIVLDQIPSKYKQGNIHRSHPEITIPNNIPGVWTSEDDNLLLSEHSADVNVVRQKHGEIVSDNRLRCLNVLLAR
ncbi:hypothetical protein LTR84_005974 [Exophiala bonariae]|uniref:DNA-binding protein RAP1 n=1 Tax=Exophiala bonariae TaxID=1690606 RepID=A0AAV9N5U2_9EURO|nr:hypothetical protein LTR84_005974 [Exophiala bonariae]